MTVFLLIAAALVAAALLFIVPPLLGRRTRSAPMRNNLNAAVYGDQLRELDSDLASGTLSPEHYENSRRELETRLLQDVAVADEPQSPLPARKAGAAIAAGIAVPVLAVALYVLTGTPQALSPEIQAGKASSHALDEAKILAMVEKLAARMRENPGDGEGWTMLARSYAVIGRFTEASQAYARAVELVPGNAQLYADYADALAMAQGRKLEGEPEKLIARAISIDPDNVKARALAGTVAFEKRDFSGAIAHWERILRVVPPESELARPVQASIDEAKALAAGSGKSTLAEAAPAAKPAGATAAAPEPKSIGGAVSGVVQLAPEVAKQVSPTDTLFVFARPVEGSRAPVAILRAQAKDLPFQFTLDDRTSIMGGARLSEQKLVIVGARISKSGNAIAQPGDVQGYSAPVGPGAAGLRILISEVAK